MICLEIVPSSHTWIVTINFYIPLLRGRKGKEKIFQSTRELKNNRKAKEQIEQQKKQAQSFTFSNARISINQNIPTIGTSTEPSAVIITLCNYNREPLL